MRTPVKDIGKLLLCTAQVRSDVVSFGTISIHYIQLVKQNIGYACWAVGSIVREVYALQNYLSEFHRQSGTPLSVIRRHTTLQPAF